MPEDVAIPTAPAQGDTPQTTQPDTTGIPSTYEDYLNQQDYYKRQFQLPLAQKKEMFDSVKPKDNGDYLTLTTAKTLLGKQKEVVQPVENNIGNRILKQKADILDGISKQYGLEPMPKKEEVTPTQEKDVAARTKEFNKQLQKIYDVPRSALKENMILPIPKGWNAPELKDVKRRQPNWSGEYIQLRKDPDTGELSWQGYNKPTAGSQTLTPAKVIADTAGRQWDGTKWIKKEPTDKDVQDYWTKEYRSSDVSAGATRLSGILRSEEEAGNYRLTQLMADHPEIAKAYKGELESAAPESVSTAGGNLTLLHNAIKKAYDLDKTVSDVQKKYSQFQYNLAVDSYSKFNDFSDLYNKQQDALSAKIINVADVQLRAAGKGQELDKMQQIQAQMMRNPAQLTDKERQDYYTLSMDLIKAAARFQQAAPFIQQFNKNLDEYKAAYVQNVQDVAMLSSPEGKAITELIQKQAVGADLYNRSLSYFPKLKEEVAKQDQIDIKGADHISNLKALLRGINTSFEDLSRQREQWGQWLGIMTPDEVVQEQKNIIPRYGNLNDILYTPNRPEQDAAGKTLYLNKLSNFMDKAMEFSGTMTPYLLSGATGAASIIPESTMFFTSGYNDYYRESKEAGLSDQDAAIKAYLGGTTLALTQLFIPKAQLVNRKLVTDEIDGLLRQSARPDAGALKNLFSRFVNPEVFENTYKGGLAVFSNDVAQNIINNYYNVSKGTQFKTDTDFGQMTEQALMFGVNASLTNALFKGSSKGEQDAARNTLLTQAEKYPVETLRSIDDAITLSYTDNHYDRYKLLQLKQDIADMHQMQFPKSFTQEQKVATWALKKQKLEWQADMGKADEAAKGMYENKIQELDGKIREVALSHEKAAEYLNETTEPLYRRLEKQGYFDDPNKQGDHVFVRHGQTDGNVKGVMNVDNEPLNATGRKEAQETGIKLKDAGYENVAYGPHLRHEQTADAIIAETGGRKMLVDELREWDRGKGADADFDYKYWTDEKHADERPPGATESFNEFLGRIQKLRGAKIADNTAIITSGQVMKLWESLDKSGGKWDEKAKIEFLKDSNDFDNTETYSPTTGKRGDIAITKTKQDAEKAKETEGEQRVLASTGSQKGTTLVQDEGADKGVPAPSKAQLKRDKEAKVQKLLGREPESPEEAILQHFVNKGKVSEEQFIRSSGFGGKDKSGLNVGMKGGKQRGGKELFGKRWALDKGGKQIDEFAEELADKFGGDSKDYEQLIVDTLLDHTKDQMINKLAKLQGFEGLSDREIIDSQAKEFAQQEMTDDEAKEYDEAMQEKRLQQVRELPDNVQKELLDVLKEYQDKDGNIDWEKMEKDSNGFDFLYGLSEESNKAINDIINKNLHDETTTQTGGADGGAPDKGGEGSQGTGKPETTEARQAAVQARYGKSVDDIIQQLKDEGRLEINCPPVGAKRRMSLRNLIKR